MAPGVRKTYRSLYIQNLGKMINLLKDIEDGEEIAGSVLKQIEKEKGAVPSMADESDYIAVEREYPVSYTHLDVYKRQAQGIGRREGKTVFFSLR